LVDFSVLVMPPRNPNGDEEDEDGEADEDEPAVIREPDE
jgi:hypothetical protein